MVGGHAASCFEIDGGCHADEVGDLVVADEAAGGLGILGVKVDGNVDGGPHGSEHLELDVPHGIDAVGAEGFKYMCGAGVAVSAVGAHLEFAVGRDVTALSGFIQSPEKSFVIDEETAHSECGGPADFFDAAGDLLLSAKAVAHPLPLFGLDGGGGVRSRPGAAGQNKLDLPFPGIFNHGLYLIVREEHDALGLGDPVYLDAIFVQGLEKGLHRAGTLDAGDLETVLTAVFESFFRCGKVVKISSGHAYALKERTGILHCVKSHNYLFILLLYPKLFQRQRHSVRDAWEDISPRRRFSWLREDFPGRHLEGPCKH